MITEMIKNEEAEIKSFKELLKMPHDGGRGFGDKIRAEIQCHDEKLKMLQSIRTALKEAINKASWEWDIGIVETEIEKIIGTYE